MKISNKDLATFYNITHATLLNYKKHKDVGYKRRYQALRDFYIKYLDGKKDETFNNKWKNCYAKRFRYEISHRNK